MAPVIIGVVSSENHPLVILGAQGLGIRVWDLGFRVQCLACP